MEHIRETVNCTCPSILHRIIIFLFTFPPSLWPKTCFNFQWLSVIVSNIYSTLQFKLRCTIAHRLNIRLFLSFFFFFAPRVHNIRSERCFTCYNNQEMQYLYIYYIRYICYELKFIFRFTYFWTKSVCCLHFTKIFILVWMNVEKARNGHIFNTQPCIKNLSFASIGEKN